MAWLSGWAKRVKLTIDNSDIDAALSNFPILLYISTSSGRNGDDISFVFDELQNDANRKKIAVTLTDGITECYVEIEEWDDASEEAWLWVKVSGTSSVASGSDTDLYLYYDSSHADNTTYVGDATIADRDGARESVWESNFKLVAHLIDKDTSTVIDSTSNDIDGTKKGANEPAVTTSGQVSNAQDFDGTDDEINEGNPSFLSNTVGTVSAWCKKDVGATDRCVWGSSDLSEADEFFQAMIRNEATKDQDDDTVSMLLYDAGFIYEVHTPVDSYPNDGAWRRVTWASDGSTIKILINGVNQALTVSSGSNNGDWFGDLPGCDQFNIGVLKYNTSAYSAYFPGIIDEFRVSSVERGAAWEKASYESERDDLLDWGSEETLTLARSFGIIMG